MYPDAGLPIGYTDRHYMYKIGQEASWSENPRHSNHTSDLLYLNDSRFVAVRAARMFTMPKVKLHRA